MTGGAIRVYLLPTQRGCFACAGQPARVAMSRQRMNWDRINQQAHIRRYGAQSAAPSGFVPARVRRRLPPLAYVAGAQTGTRRPLVTWDDVLAQHRNPTLSVLSRYYPIYRAKLAAYLQPPPIR